MKIRGTRLELQRINDLSDVIGIMSSGDLRYKTLYALSRHGDCISKDFRVPYSLDSSEIKTFMKYSGGYYTLRRTKTKNPHQEYTQTELRIMISVFTGLLGGSRIQVAEELCHAIGSTDILESFYSDYGNFKETKNLCERLVVSKNPIQTITNTRDIFPMAFQRSRYSIYRLAKDLVSSKTFICTDPELTSGYTKISRNQKTASIPLRDTWNPVVGISMNLCRANLSLIYLGKVVIKVPENTYGVVPGDREVSTLKSICLVQDGKVCNDAFGVRIESVKVRKRLKAAGILKTDLLYPGDYAARISNLPVCSKSDIRNIRSFDLASSEVWYKLSDIAIEYLLRRKYKETNNLKIVPPKLPTPELTESEKFLASLGISGDYYTPRKSVSRLEREYMASELVCTIKGMPVKSTYTAGITRLLNSVGKCNPVVSEFLGTYVIPEINGSNYPELLEKWEACKEDCRQKIRDLKFRLISGKSLEVTTHSGRRNILDIKTPIKLGNTEFECTWILKDKKILV